MTRIVKQCTAFVMLGSCGPVFVLLIAGWLGLASALLADSKDLEIFDVLKRAFASKLLFNYSKFEAPNGENSEVMDIESTCSSIFTFYESKRTIKLYSRLLMRWTDKRLAWDWTKEKNKIRRLHGIIKNGQPAAIWLPHLQSSLIATHRHYIIQNTGQVSYTMLFDGKLLCIPIYRHKFPADSFRCHMHFANPTSLRFPCANSSALACCLDKGRPWKGHTQWVKKKVWETNYTQNEVAFRSLHVVLSRSGTSNHFYITPVILLGLMTALHGLVRRTTSGLVTVSALLFAVIDTMTMLHDVPVIREGGGGRLANLCACIIMFNAINVMWSAVAENLLSVGGVSCSVFLPIIHFVERYRVLLLLPSFDQTKEENQGTPAAEWYHVSLLGDRVLSVTWFLVVVIYAMLV